MKTLDELINDFKKLGKALIGQSPQQIGGDQYLVNIEAFLKIYPTMVQDQGFVDYLKRYSGAVIDWSNENSEQISDLLIELIQTNGQKGNAN